MYTIAAFYHFCDLPAAAALRLALKEALSALDLCGSLLVAPEGINGTLAGSAENIDALLALLNRETGLPRDVVKFSEAGIKPFGRLKVRLKREIITFNQPQANPAKCVGTYVAPQDWNALVADPEVLLLDTRNRYETRIGTFAGAVDPGIEHFSDFATYVREKLDPTRHRKVAMFCTGGVRCEKASSFMLQEGFAEVFHLQGGILKYLEETPIEQSHWQGECYMFDKRMAVGHGLTTGNYAMCFSCGEPLNEADRANELYEQGVSCGFCHAATSDEDKTRFRERQRQITTG
jgi:UPF0176 protein